MMREIKTGFRVKDMMYPEERIYKVVSVESDAVIPVVFLKTKEKLGRFEVAKFRTPIKTFWDRFQRV